MYFELHAYQHHVFMDWRFVEDEKWAEIHDALNGGGMDSMQTKWDELFGEKENVVEEEVKVKKPRKKAAEKKTIGKKPTTKKKRTASKSDGKKAATKNKKVTSKRLRKKVLSF